MERRQSAGRIPTYGTGAAKTAPLPTDAATTMVLHGLKQRTAFSCHNISNQICICGARTLMHVNECARLPLSYVSVISRARLSTRARIKFWHREHHKRMHSPSVLCVCVMRAVRRRRWCFEFCCGGCEPELLPDATSRINFAELARAKPLARNSAAWCLLPM